MKNIYSQNTAFFKALADTNRLMIVDMLSCGEMCACEILEKFNITQPTLSHHMKILCDCGLVSGRKAFANFKEFLNVITSPKADCICNCKEVCSCE